MEDADERACVGSTKMQKAGGALLIRAGVARSPRLLFPCSRGGYACRCLFEIVQKEPRDGVEIRNSGVYHSIIFTNADQTSAIANTV